MTRTAPRAPSLQNYWENPRMRAVREGASRSGKSRPDLRMDLAALGPYAMTSGQIFSRPALPLSQ